MTDDSKVESIEHAPDGVKSYYAQKRAQQRLKRENNRLYAIEFLKRHKVPFVALNHGYMLRITETDEVIDFYPTTGLWQTKSETRRGIFNLWKYVRDKLPKEDVDGCGNAG